MDTFPPVHEISEKIIYLIESSGDRSILGVRLGASLKLYFPNFRPIIYQVRNLRQFIRTYVPKVCERPYSGVDVLYSVASATVPTPEPGTKSEGEAPPEFIRIPVDGYKWKAYSNPGYRFVIAANRETGELQVVSESTRPQTPWVVIPKPSGEAHRAIAKEFVATLAEPNKTFLSRLLEDPKWYVRFSHEIRRAGVGTHWAAFRRAQLIALLDKELRGFGIPTPVPVSPQSNTQAPASTSSPATEASPSPVREDIDFRELVQRVIGELPISELRLLRLPIGIVFDALKK